MRSVVFSLPKSPPHGRVWARVNTVLINPLGTSICRMTSPVCVTLFTRYRMSFNSSKCGNTLSPCSSIILLLTCTTFSYCLARAGSSLCL
ncbi:hypothetical protein FKM82_020967 [Ascaphus truei]